jgi:hypothetical protein
MKMFIYIWVTLLIAIIFSSDNPESYLVLERSLPLVLGASLGGVLACTSIIISVLSSSSEKTKTTAQSSQKYQSFVTSLENDVKLLVICLFLTVSLPYLRTLEYPITIELFGLSVHYLKHKFFSIIEVFVAILAFLIIFEIVTVLVSILRKMMVIQTKD